MKIQIHKALAEVIGVEPDENGHYFCDDKMTISIKEVVAALNLNDVNWKIKLIEKSENNGKTQI